MKEKRYEFKLIITAEEVRLCSPGGTYWAHARDNLPGWLFDLAQQALSDDSKLCHSLQGEIKRAPEVEE